MLLNVVKYFHTNLADVESSLNWAGNFDYGKVEFFLLALQIKWLIYVINAMTHGGQIYWKCSTT